MLAHEEDQYTDFFVYSTKHIKAGPRSSRTAFIVFKILYIYVISF